MGFRDQLEALRAQREAMTARRSGERFELDEHRFFAGADAQPVMGAMAGVLTRSAPPWPPAPTPIADRDAQELMQDMRDMLRHMPQSNADNPGDT